MTSGWIASNAGINKGVARSGEASDRRLARGNRTRTFILEGMIALIDGGNPRPTRHQVAARADIAVRSLYHHFATMDAMFQSSVELHLARHRALVATIPPRGPIAARIRVTCQQRRQFFEVVAPLLRVANGRAQESPSLQGVLSRHRSDLRQHLAVTFGPEIAARGVDATVLLDALDLTTGWQSWIILRLETGHSASSAEQLMAYAVACTLG